MSTIFSKIIEGEIPGHFIYEDELCVAIMDKFPAVTGQAIVVPREPVDYLFDLPDETYAHLFSVTKRLARALDTVFATERTCLVVEGFEVPHTHIKLYPMTTTEPLGQVMPEQQEADDEALAAQAKRIRHTLAALA